MSLLIYLTFFYLCCWCLLRCINLAWIMDEDLYYIHRGTSRYMYGIIYLFIYFCFEFWNPFTYLLTSMGIENHENKAASHLSSTSSPYHSCLPSTSPLCSAFSQPRSSLSSMGGNPPCTPCEFLRRRRAKDIIFTPYLSLDDLYKFAIVHKVFGANNSYNTTTATSWEVGIY